MMTFTPQLKRLEFEARIFVSLGIVATVTVPSLTLFTGQPSWIGMFGGLLGLEAATAVRWGYLLVAAFLALCSILRMWAGSILTPECVMAFAVRVDKLNTEGPYRLVRNPIYLADFGAMCAFALCLPWVGVVMPFLFFVHYVNIIRYEEVSLFSRFGSAYERYAREVPRLLPSPSALRHLPRALGEFRLTAEGFRHNALFVLFVPGFCVAAFTDNFLHALIVGLPGVIDWAVIHTIIGRRKHLGVPS